MSKQILKKNRRAFIKGLFALIFLKKFQSNFVSAEEELAYLLEGPLAGNFYYTKKKPGRWNTLIESHLPLFEINNNILEVSTLHEMRGYEHYIIKLIVLDKWFYLISE